MRIGYARVSTIEQNLDLQTDALEKAGCLKIFKEKVSSSLEERPVFNMLLLQLREGDQVVVWKLDRLGRSIKELIKIITQFKEEGVTLISLNEGIDTSTPSGKFTFSIFAALAEFERELIRERTKAGLTAARARGRLGGRPKGLSKIAIEKAKTVQTLYDAGGSMQEIVKVLNVANSTGYRYLKYIRNKTIDNSNNNEK